MKRAVLLTLAVTPLIWCQRQLYPAAKDGGTYMQNYYLPPAPSSYPWSPSWAPDGKSITTRDAVHVFMGGAHHVFAVVDPYLPTTAGADAHGGLTAPMPGRVLSVLVKAGDRVSRGAPLMILEAMKMEHTVTAPTDGTVEKVMCSEGEQVREGAELLARAPA